MNITTTPDDDIPSDETLAKEVQRGDMEAFGTLYTRYLPMVGRHVWRRHEQAPQAKREDLVQDIFVRALELIGTFNETDYECFRHWLFTVPAVRVLIWEEMEHRRSWQGLQGVKDQLQRGAGCGLVCVATEPGCQMPAELLAALDEIHPDWREALELHYVDGLPYETVAEVMGRSPKSIKGLLARARTYVRSQCGIGESAPAMKRTRGVLRAQILAVAGGLFAEHGLDGVSLRRIAAASGCDVNSLKHYFPSKQALFAEATATTCQAVAA